MLRFLTAGESHGPGLVTIVEGLPKGIVFKADLLANELARRRLGYGRGARMKIEQDEIEVLGGVRHGQTLGSPVAILVRNSEAEKWSRQMSVEEVDEAIGKVTRPRPGHADMAGMVKYQTDDARDILERASARETAARTVAGFLARSLIGAGGVEVRSHVVSIGEIDATVPWATLSDFDEVDTDPVRCLDPEASQAMVAEIDRVTEEKDTLGGVVEIVGFGLPVGIGSHVHFDRKLDGLIGQAMLSIPAIKGVEVGDGFEVARRPGSRAHDEMAPAESGVSRPTNRAGGLEGGITNGEPLRVRAAMKPISTLMRPLRTVDMESGEEAIAVRERSDVCAVPAAAVVGEQMVSWVLAVEMLRKFGGDTLEEFTDRVEGYRRAIEGRFET